MNIKRFALCTIAGFAFLFGFDFVFHGNILMSSYEQTAHLWRPTSETEQYFPWMLLTQFLTSAIAAFIFTRNYEASCIIGEGIRFGLMMGLFLGVIQFSTYAYMPISMGLALAWFGGAIVRMVGLGVIFSLLYRK